MCTSAKQIMGWTLGLIAQQQTEAPHPTNKFISAVLQKGGAEGWVQVELDAIYKTLPKTAWVQREQPIYKDQGKAVDFLIKCQDGPLTCIELKVESLYQSAELGHVTIAHGQWQRVQADITKLQTERSPEFSDAQAFVVAIVWSAESIVAIDSWVSETGLPFFREQYQAQAENSPWPVTVYVIAV